MDGLGWIEKAGDFGLVGLVLFGLGYLCLKIGRPLVTQWVSSEQARTAQLVIQSKSQQAQTEALKVILLRTAETQESVRDLRAAIGG